MSYLRFTKHAVAAIPHPTSGQKLYRDSGLTGFGLRVGTKSKVYIAEGQVNGRTCRTSIGRADVFCPDVARKMALTALSEMAMGTRFRLVSSPILRTRPAPWSSNMRRRRGLAG